MMTDVEMANRDRPSTGQSNGAQQPSMYGARQEDDPFGYDPFTHGNADTPSFNYDIDAVNYQTYNGSRVCCPVLCAPPRRKYTIGLVAAVSFLILVVVLFSSSATEPHHAGNSALTWTQIKFVDADIHWKDEYSDATNDDTNKTIEGIQSTLKATFGTSLDHIESTKLSKDEHEEADADVKYHYTDVIVVLEFADKQDKWDLQYTFDKLHKAEPDWNELKVTAIAEPVVVTTTTATTTAPTATTTAPTVTTAASDGATTTAAPAATTSAIVSSSTGES